MRIKKILKIFNSIGESCNHEHHRIPYENYKNHENHKVPRENHENHENHKMQYENYGNYENT